MRKHIGVKECGLLTEWPFMSLHFAINDPHSRFHVHFSSLLLNVALLVRDNWDYLSAHKGGWLRCDFIFEIYDIVKVRLSLPCWYCPAMTQVEAALSDHENPYTLTRLAEPDND